MMNVPPLYMTMYVIIMHMYMHIATELPISLQVHFDYLTRFIILIVLLFVLYNENKLEINTIILIISHCKNFIHFIYTTIL